MRAHIHTHTGYSPSVTLTARYHPRLFFPAPHSPFGRLPGFPRSRTQEPTSREREKERKRNVERSARARDSFSGIMHALFFSPLRILAVYPDVMMHAIRVIRLMGPWVFSLSLSLSRRFTESLPTHEARKLFFKVFYNVPSYKCTKGSRWESRTRSYVSGSLVDVSRVE